IGDLFGLTRGEVKGRESDGECTVFKSVGHSLEDFVAAVAVVKAAPK
ncbi:MAG TPA: ornithine cyclodeaminase family protein, partial [Thalassospira lucentensis]|nr:ornithine cyclodeaminase family protein [Thalassospira lucentensis]